MLDLFTELFSESLLSPQLSTQLQNMFVSFFQSLAQFSKKIVLSWANSSKNNCENLSQLSANKKFGEKLLEKHENTINSLVNFLVFSGDSKMPLIVNAICLATSKTEKNPFGEWFELLLWATSLPSFKICQTTFVFWSALVQELQQTSETEPDISPNEIDNKNKSSSLFSTGSNVPNTNQGISNSMSFQEKTKIFKPILEQLSSILFSQAQFFEIEGLDEDVDLDNLFLSNNNFNNNVQSIESENETSRNERPTNEFSEFRAELGDILMTTCFGFLFDEFFSFCLTNLKTEIQKLNDHSPKDVLKKLTRIESLWFSVCSVSDYIKESNFNTLPSLNSLFYLIILPENSKMWLSFPEKAAKLNNETSKSSKIDEIFQRIAVEILFRTICVVGNYAHVVFFEIIPSNSEPQLSQSRLIQIFEFFNNCFNFFLKQKLWIYLDRTMKFFDEICQQASKIIPKIFPKHEVPKFIFPFIDSLSSMLKMMEKENFSGSGMKQIQNSIEKSILSGYEAISAIAFSLTSFSSASENNPQYHLLVQVIKPICEMIGNMGTQLQSSNDQQQEYFLCFQFEKLEACFDSFDGSEKQPNLLLVLTHIWQLVCNTAIACKTRHKVVKVQNSFFFFTFT